MSNLESAINTLLGRIDALTTRLDGLEKTIASGAAAGGASSATAGGAAPAAASGASALFVKEYQDLLDQYIKPLVALSNKFGSPELKKQVDLVDKALAQQKKLLEIAAASAKPAGGDLTKLVEPTSKLMSEIVAIRDANRPSSQFNHLSTLSEGISALGWVVVEPTPGPHVDETRASSEFYSNKLLVQYKGKDQDQVDWVSNWNTFLKELAKYIKKFHTTGLAWNPKGGNALSASTAAPARAGPPPPPAGGPPPPPPPTSAAAPAAKQADMNAVFSALNKGTEITSGLRKVQDHEKTKNRKPEEKVSVVPSSAVAPKEEKAAAGKAAGKAITRPPKFALEGNKWVIEYQKDNKNIIIDQTELKQTAYIYKCTGSVVQVKGKINSIIVDDSSHLGVVFENVVASCEVVNSKSVEIQVTGKVPSISIDKSSAVQLFLSKDALDVEIVTSKSDTMNVLIPVQGQPDPVEIPIPEQFKTMYKGGKLVTTSMEHA